MKRLKKPKWVALPLSLLLAFNATVQSSLAFVITSTPAALNTFKPYQSIEGDLIISKTVEHPFGEDYVIPENIAFDFQVELGALYAGYTLTTTQGNFTTDENGILTVSVKPGVPIGIEGIDEGMQVTVTELQKDGDGFAVKDDAAAQTVTVSPDNQIIVDFINIYTPAPVSPDHVSVSGVKVLEGREWQEGDTFDFLLERQDENGEWISMGTRSIAYSTETADFNTFDFSDLIQTMEFTEIGTYAFRMSEVIGTLENVVYDATVNTFNITVGDADMDGSLEIQDVAAAQNAAVTKDDAADTYSVDVTFNNIFTPEETTTTETSSTTETTTVTEDTTTKETSTTEGTTTSETTPATVETTSTTSTSADTTTESTTSQTTTTETTTTQTTTSETTTSQTTTTETTSSTEETTATETTTTTEPAATWTVGKVTAYAGDTGVVVPITVTGDTGLISYLFNLTVDAGLNLTGAEAGEAYTALEMMADLIAKQFGGTNVTLGENLIAEDGSVVINLIFDIPADAEPGKYSIGFAGDVEAYTIDGIPLNVTEESGYIQILPPDVTIVGYNYVVDPGYQFYFAHDRRPFSPADLIETVTRYAVYSDGTVDAEGTVISVAEANLAFNVPGWTYPEEVYQNQVLDENGEVKIGFYAYYTGSIPCTITDEFGTHEIESSGTAYIAVKGDTSLDGIVNSVDASQILVYAAEYGSGVTDARIHDAEEHNDPYMEDFVYFLGDVDTEHEHHGLAEDGALESPLNSPDASSILVYAAVKGSGAEAKWENILDEPLPIYTKAIAEYNAANP